MAGRICLLQSASSDDNKFFVSESYKLNMFQLFFPLLNISIILYLRIRVKRFMSELCPRKQMSCIGMYKRNVISLQMTICWLIIWDLSSFLDYGFQTLLAVLAKQDISLSTPIVFWIWNIKGFVFNEGLHFVLPSFLEIPSNFDRKRKRNAFYARKPGSLEPRRETVEESELKEKKSSKKQNSLLLSARELLNKVPSKLVKVDEFKLEDPPKCKTEERDKSSTDLRKRELKDGELAISSSSLNNKEHFLSIPKSSGGHLRKRQPYIIYCRHHNSFVKHSQ